MLQVLSHRICRHVEYGAVFAFRSFITLPRESPFRAPHCGQGLDIVAALAFALKTKLLNLTLKTIMTILVTRFGSQFIMSIRVKGKCILVSSLQRHLLISPLGQRSMTSRINSILMSTSTSGASLQKQNPNFKIQAFWDRWDRYEQVHCWAQATFWLYLPGLQVTKLVRLPMKLFDLEKGPFVIFPENLVNHFIVDW